MAGLDEKHLSPENKVDAIKTDETIHTELCDSPQMAMKIICDFEESTKSNYITLKKTKDFGNEGFQVPSNARVHWECHSIQLDVFNPYVIVGKQILQCHLGKDTGLAKKQKYSEQRDLKQGDEHSIIKRRRIIQDTKKMGCTASIQITHIILYPEYEIKQSTEKRRKTASSKLREALQRDRDNVKVKHAYKIVLPNLSDHMNHETTGEVANLRERIDARVKRKIIDLYRNGVRRVAEMKRHMDAFVLKELFLGLELPEETRRRYYPTRKDLANLMYKAKSEGHDSTLDQENILDLIEQWKVQNPNDKMFCRPSCCTTENKHQTFLFCYQNDWQQKLLTMYGNHITLLDATYRTTRYALPLFFLCVRSNVCYLVVGAFVTQEENTASIKEALQLFKNWNKEWKPKCFLVDFCQEEINAILETFPASKVLFCDFHREKAWTEWTSKKDHNVYDFRKTILSMLRKIALARTMDEHQNSLKNLMESKIWKTCSALRHWFSNKWLPEIEKWAHVYRTGELQIAIHTNNGLERQNEVLKHTYMEGYKNCTLSELLIVLHKHFFPNAHKKYIQLNVQNCETYRKYKKEIPDFLRNRPKNFVWHMMTRLDTTLDNSHIKCLDRKSGVFEVNSEENAAKTYTVTFKDGIPSCTCADWEKHFVPCKHICCILKYDSELKWDRLNPVYSQNPLFLLDEGCLCVSRGEPKIEQETDYMATPLPDSNVVALPERRKSRRNKLIHNCVQNLKRIIDCTYLQKNESYLEELDENIKILLQDVQANIPLEKDLPLIETPKKKSISDNIHPLKKAQYGRSKQFGSNRYGQKAEMLKDDTWKTVFSNDESQKEQGPSSNWLIINNITLTLADKSVIQNNDWLDDNIINTCQHLISKQFGTISGFFDTVLLANGFLSLHDSDHLLQIHHAGAHWVVSERHNRTVTIYDSLKSLQLSEELKKQLLLLYAPLFSGEYSVLDVHLVCYQQQIGASDCGLFAIANIVALANGYCLADVMFTQSEMRSHLVQCMEQGLISMFPFNSASAPPKPKCKNVTMTTHCSCNIHKPGQSMVECWQCKKWFHFKCVGITKNDSCVKTNKKFTCANCGN